MNKNFYILIAMGLAMGVTVLTRFQSDSLDRKAMSKFREGCDFDSVGVRVGYLSGKQTDEEKIVPIRDKQIVYSIWKTIAEAEVVPEKKAGVYDVTIYITFYGKTSSFANLFKDNGSDRVVGSLTTRGQELPIAFNDEGNIIGELLTAYGMPP
jgi:hypothetical protein